MIMSVMQKMEEDGRDKFTVLFSVAVMLWVVVAVVF